MNHPNPARPRGDRQFPAGHHDMATVRLPQSAVRLEPAHNWSHRTRLSLPAPPPNTRPASPPAVPIQNGVRKISHIAACLRRNVLVQLRHRRSPAGRLCPYAPRPHKSHTANQRSPSRTHHHPSIAKPVAALSLVNLSVAKRIPALAFAVACTFPMAANWTRFSTKRPPRPLSSP